MKMNEMNAHQREAYRWIKEAMSEIIGGYENQMLDYLEEDEEYKSAEEFLNQGHDGLVGYIYDVVMENTDKGTQKHLRFAGTEFIKAMISKMLTKWGY